MKMPDLPPLEEMTREQLIAMCRTLQASTQRLADLLEQQTNQTNEWIAKLHRRIDALGAPAHGAPKKEGA